MKKAWITICVFVAILAVLCIGCFSCGSNATVETDVTASVDTGDVSAGDITAGNQSVELVNEAPYTFAELIRDIYKDLFTRIVLSIIIVLWATGNLHPNKNFSLFDKGSKSKGK